MSEGCCTALASGIVSMAKRFQGSRTWSLCARGAVLFVHGCFWHMHRCKYGKPVPATNVSFWAEKRRSNVERDKRNRAALHARGWRVFEIWECHTRTEEKMRAKLEPLIQFLNGCKTSL